MKRSLRSAVANAALAVLAVLAVVVAVELAFRIAPGLLLPPGNYGAGRPSEALGFNVHGSRVFYTKAGHLVVREPNPDGFLDLARDPAKPSGTVRVGFFGDSYVESAQVPLPIVFYRQLEDRLREQGVETLGFGVSGWGGVHALRAFEVFGPRYDLDVAVYAFVENDPGDQSYELAAARGLGASMPFAEPSDDDAGYRLRWTVEPDAAPWWFGAAKWVQRRSLLAHLVRDRFVVLRQAGVRVRAAEGDRDMTRRADGIPDPNDLPGSWPEPVRERTLRLAELVLADWKRTTERYGTRLLVLYVPRGEPQLRGEIRREDTWLPWLEEATARLGIPLLDPSQALRTRLDAGASVYSDHWTPDGNAVLARFLADRLQEFLPARAAVPAPGLR